MPTSRKVVLYEINVRDELRNWHSTQLSIQTPRRSKCNCGRLICTRFAAGVITRMHSRMIIHSPCLGAEQAQEQAQEQRRWSRNVLNISLIQQERLLRQQTLRRGKLHTLTPPSQRETLPLESCGYEPRKSTGFQLQLSSFRAGASGG